MPRRSRSPSPRRGKVDEFGRERGGPVQRSKDRGSSRGRSRSRRSSSRSSYSSSGSSRSRSRSSSGSYTSRSSASRSRSRSPRNRRTSGSRRRSLSRSRSPPRRRAGGSRGRRSRSRSRLRSPPRFRSRRSRSRRSRPRSRSLRSRSRSSRRDRSRSLLLSARRFSSSTWSNTASARPRTTSSPRSGGSSCPSRHMHSSWSSYRGSSRRYERKVSAFNAQEKYPDIGMVCITPHVLNPRMYGCENKMHTLSASWKSCISFSPMIGFVAGTAPSVSLAVRSMSSGSVKTMYRIGGGSSGLARKHRACLFISLMNPAAPP
eukprot:m.324766 g.324766  ORF g.324766 m.324766 type:complete len:318 (-) comp20374_c0_seq12:820-1773(-)